MKEEHKPTLPEGRVGETSTALLLKAEKPTIKETLANYSHIELTDEEFDDAILCAKIKKVEQIRIQKFKEFEEENRKLKAMRWNFDIIKTWMMKRAEGLFKGKFTLDDDNEDLFDLLCYYFIEDEVKFISTANRMGVKNPSLKKGLLIPGHYGCGKTWMMQLFSRQTKQCFDIVRAKDIAEEYLTSKDKRIPKMYLNPFDVNDENNNRGYVTSDIFNQKYIGMCIDDLGSEAIQNNFGNKMNVIGDLIESRYASGFTGAFLHGTTNLAAKDIEGFYGKRVSSRMREIFNFIALPGGDRRK